MVGGPEIPRQEFERAEKELQSQAIMLKEEGFECETLLSVRGLETGEDIVKIAEEKGAEEIVIGVQRKSKVGKVLIDQRAAHQGWARCQKEGLGVPSRRRARSGSTRTGAGKPD